MSIANDTCRKTSINFDKTCISTEFDTVTKKILKNNSRKAQGPIVAGIKEAMLQIMHPILGEKCC